MEPSKISRSEAIDKLAESVSPRGTIANIPGTFLGDAKVYLSLSDAELGQWYGVSRTNILRKRSTVTERKKKSEPSSHQEPRQHSQATRGDDIFPDFCDMATEDKIAYITRKYDRCIDGQESLTKEQIAALKARLEDLRGLQAEETQEGKEHVSKLLNIIMKDWVRDFKSAFETSFPSLKADIARTALDTLWADLDKLKRLSEADDIETIKDSILHKLQGIVADMGTEFDIVALFSQTARRHSLIHEQINKYLASQEAPRFVGGGSVKSAESVQGGAQYRQQAREVQRKAAQQGGSKV